MADNINLASIAPSMSDGEANSKPQRHCVNHRVSPIKGDAHFLFSPYLITLQYAQARVLYYYII